MATGDETTVKRGKKHKNTRIALRNRCKKPKPAKNPNKTMNPCTSNDNSPEGGFPFPGGCGGASPAATARTFGGGAGGAAAARPRERERRPRRGSARVTQRVTERARSAPLPLPAEMPAPGQHSLAAAS